ncbi:WD40-repeat-containing domain protein [Lasiosphaeris hirsuta]|uniref:WD40-repeat-containing domain protein n=1 Tax=Lasiosphaeris hirsuta TaxID=260670 RepID=A0AA40BBV4_9PEZI|nr:WD40-repeat-containing domain protein [Lasiosphaeris hirsuta]
MFDLAESPLPANFEVMNRKKEITSKLRPNLNLLLTPVTALAIYQPQSGHVFVLAGEDIWLKVYDVGSSRPLGQLKIFRSQPIHGINVSQPDHQLGVNGGRLLIWGAQSVAVLSKASLQSLIEGHAPASPTEFEAPDWIYDGILLPSPSADGVLVTAHNEIIPILANSSQDSVVFGPLTSPSRPILYSADLCWLPAGDVLNEAVLVAGGTVFGEIIVWKYYLNATRQSQLEMLFVFTGHEGSIFGISISPEIEIAPDVKVRLLASCSDDRTIRIWDITDRAPTDKGASTPHLGALAAARETGFGGNSEVKVENKDDSSRCLAVVMGHMSRIWHVKFSGRTNHHSPQKSYIDVYSFGEDCSRQFWELTFDAEAWQKTHELRPGDDSLESRGSDDRSTSEMTGALLSRTTERCHSGKNIWSAAVKMIGDVPLVASGGADGRIVLSGKISNLDAIPQPAIDGTPPKPDYRDIDLALSFDDVNRYAGGTPEFHESNSTNNVSNKASKDCFHRYVFLSEETLLATTTYGRFFLGTVKDSITWQEIPVPEAIQSDLRSFHVVKSPAPHTAIFGTVSGRIYLFQESHEIKEVIKFSAKITDIICLPASGQHPMDKSNSQAWSVIVTILGLSYAPMLGFNNSTGLALRQPIPYDPAYQNYIITAATFCGRHLIIGSRVGAITVYEIGPNNFIPLMSNKITKSKDAVTCLLPMSNDQNSFLAGCRDGRYSIFNLEGPLIVTHGVPTPIGMIEGGWFAKSDSGEDLILYGFTGKYFFVWNDTSRIQLAFIECGGAHRPFAYTSTPGDPNQLRLVFVKASQLRVYSQRRPALLSLKSGGHGREIRAVAACEHWVATAAEDTTILIWACKDSEGRSLKNIKLIAALEKHTAGIQCLKWYRDRYLLSSAGNEELFIWTVGGPFMVKLHDVYRDFTPDRDLRIMDIDVHDYHVPEISHRSTLVSFVLSDSTFRTYEWFIRDDGESEGLHLLATGRYTGACPTQIRQLRTKGLEIHVLTASTDGCVALWVAAGELDPDSHKPSFVEFSLVSVFKLHQSSIKCLDLSAREYATGVRWIIITGGDDNALGFLDLIWCNKKRAFVFSKKSRVKDAHAAAITGLRIVGEGEGMIEVATVSNDQRVKLWRASRKEVKDGNGGVTVALVDNQYSSVADAGDIELVDFGKLMVGGVGMEVWDISGG